MSALPKQRVTEAEYLAIENASEARHEYRNGEIVEMPSGNPEHSLILGSSIATLHTQLRKRPCHLFSIGMRLRVSAAKLYTYADISVVCGQPEYTQDDPPSLLNPTVIIEVLSPWTEAYDRGAKFQHYRALDSLQEYVLIAQDSARIECFTRQAEGNTWVFMDAVGLEASIDLTSIGCTLALADMYEKVMLPQPPEML